MSVPSDDALWCRRYHTAISPKSRLVCLPHAGGSASFFFPLSAALGTEIDVLAIQYPGRQDRRNEPPVKSIAALADCIFHALRHQPEMPLTFFGHSMGSILAFEVTRRFEAEGDDPVCMFASGRRAPSTYRDETVHLRDDASILAEVRSLNGTASSVLGDDEMIRAALPALRADYRAVETYEYEPETIVKCPISVLVGKDDPKTTLAEAKAWASHTSGSFDLRVFPGGHFFLTGHSEEIMDILRSHFGIGSSRATAVSARD